MTESFHDPVMVAEVMDLLAPGPDKTVLDGTLGGGGHSEALLRGGLGRLIGLDRDDEALARAGERLAAFGDRAVIRKSDFAEMGAALDGLGIETVDGILLDLGVSRHQLTAGHRGFSLRQDGPLDMRMDPAAGETAAELLARLSEREIADLLFSLGEEPASRRIAREIAARRKAGQPARTTAELRAAVEKAAGTGRPGHIHPATRTFMALRIAVNDELGRLDRALAEIPGRLKPGGRAVVISYHSLEDRRVKTSFAGEAKGCDCPPQFPVCVCGKKPRLKLLTRKAAVPTPAEVETNPAARSAKLRAAERLET